MFLLIGCYYLFIFIYLFILYPIYIYIYVYFLHFVCFLLTQEKREVVAVWT